MSQIGQPATSNVAAQQSTASQIGQSSGNFNELDIDDFSEVVDQRDAKSRSS